MSNLLNTIKQEPTIFLFIQTWRCGRGFRFQLCFAIIFIIIGFLLISIEPLIIAKVINIVQIEGVTRENLKVIFSWLIFVPILMIVSHGAGWTEYYFRVWARINITGLYRRKMVDKIFARSSLWIDQHDSGSLIDQVDKSAKAIGIYMSMLHRIVSIAVSIPVSLLAVYYFSGSIVFFAILIMIVIFYVIYQFDKKIIPIIKERNAIQNQYSASLYDAISNVNSIKILSIGDLVSEKVQKINEKNFLPIMRILKIDESKWFIANLVFSITIFFGSFAGYVFGALSSGDVVLVGAMTALYQYLNRLDDAFFNMSDVYSELRKLKADFENAEEIESFKISRKKRILTTVSKSINFKDLTFYYIKIPALKDLSLRINKGEKIALIGESGSGKTTFLKVLHGLYDDVQGDIEIDGTKIDKQLHELDLGTTLVPQEPELFSSSVRENITFGLDYTDEDIRTVTDLAQFTGVVKTLPAGLESKINEKGVNLSGGQKQRLALARALLFAQDKDIILLDESTSSVDPENENKIYQNIFKHFYGKTCIASIHKMNLLKYFDRIVMFKDGTISDQGTFDELLRNNPEFKTMWQEFTKSQQ